MFGLPVDVSVREPGVGASRPDFPYGIEVKSTSRVASPMLRVPWATNEAPYPDRTIYIVSSAVLVESKPVGWKTGSMAVPTGIRMSEVVGPPAPIVRSITVSRLAKSVRRNRVIVEWVDRAARQGRTVLVIGERRDQLQHLYDSVETSSKGLALGVRETSKKRKKAAQEARKVAIREQVVFATGHVDTGFSKESTDTVFLLYPFSGEGRLRQTVGRILRELQGKKEAIAVVFVDDVVPPPKKRAMFGHSFSSEMGVWERSLLAIEENASLLGYRIRKR
jgi:hypothetical protein